MLRGIRGLVEDGPLAFVTLDREGLVRTWSRAAEVMTGFPAAEVLGRLLPTVPEAGRAGHERLLGEVLAGRSVSGVDVTRRRKDGTGIVLRLLVSPIHDRGGHVVGVMGIMEDVTAARQAEAEQERLRGVVERASKEWQATFDAVESPLLLLDVDGGVRRVNRAGMELAGRDFRAIVGRGIRELPGQPWQAVAQAAAEVAAGRSSFCGPCTDDAGRTWDLALAWLHPRGDAEEGVVAIVRDVTGIVRLQETIQRQETMAVLGSLVAGVAHEVRNPLFAMTATLDAFQARFGVQPEHERYLVTLRGEVQRLTRLMKDLLDYGKPAQVQIIPTDVSALAAEVVRGVGTLAARNGVSIEMSGPVGEVIAALDGARVGQVLRNLIENAIAHSPRGGIVHLKVVAGAGSVDLVVSDQGDGFVEADLPRVFEPFFTRRHGGTGLGLSIVQRIVEAHGGRVAAANGPAGGAQVTVRLPWDGDRRA